MSDKEIELFGVTGDYAQGLGEDAIQLALEIERGDRDALAHRLVGIQVVVSEMVAGLAANS